jgi:hypothetical protein
MRLQLWFGSLVLAGAALIGLASSGCTKTDTPTAKDKTKIAGKNGDEHKEAKADSKKDDHSGWWCGEHGVPEEICSLCSDAAAAKFKKAGDWCKIHDRAQSQCFKCDPTLYKKYEAMYVAKYGKTPEPPPKEEFEK